MTEADDQAHNMILGLLMSELYWCIVLTHRYILKSTQFPCYFFFGRNVIRCLMLAAIFSTCSALSIAPSSHFSL